MPGGQAVTRLAERALDFQRAALVIVGIGQEQRRRQIGADALPVGPWTRMALST